MKNFLLLCILVILGYTVAAQQPNSVDSLYANVIFPNTQVNDTKAAIKGNNTVITAKTGNVFDGIMLVNNVSYTAIKLAGDNPGTASECYSVKFSETSDSIFALKFLWSIAVEEQFYLIFILFGFLFRKHFWVFVSILIGVYIGFMIIANQLEMNTYTHTLTHFSNFAIGMSAAYVFYHNVLSNKILVAPKICDFQR